MATAKLKEKIKPQRKFVSFSTDPSDIRKIEQAMKDGWVIVMLVPYGEQYVGIMEKVSNDNSDNPEERIIYIPGKEKRISFK